MRRDGLREWLEADIEREIGHRGDGKRGGVRRLEKSLHECGIVLLRHGRQQSPASHGAAGFEFVGEIVPRCGP